MNEEDQYDDEPADDVTETGDGGAIVDLNDGEDEKEVTDNLEFYANIISIFDQPTLETMASDLLAKIDLDKQSRSKRIDQYTDALRRTGLGNDAPGGATFQGASQVIHPILIESVIDYSSRMVAELIPPDGPVKMYIPGETTKARVEKAERKAKHMNWQMKTQMKEFKTEIEQISTQEPLGGVAYLRLVYDSVKRRPVPTFIPVDDIYIPFACSSFYTAERLTWAETITSFEFERRIRDGMYRAPTEVKVTEEGKPNVIAPSSAPDETKAAEANRRIEGKDPEPTNVDGQRVVFLVQCYLDGEEDSKYNPDKRPAPYLVSVDQTTREIVSIVRNWEDEDEAFETMFWIIEWPFIPWRGAYPIGLNQVMAGIPAAVTGALRALMDSAHTNNLPSLLKLKGANFVGQTNNVQLGQVTELEGGISGGDIRQLIMAIPFNQPSAVLYSLMGMLVETGKGVVRTTLDNLAEHSNQMPATTAMALIEQGMKVMSAIHLRQWTAMDNTISVLHRINRLYITDKEILDDTGTMLAYREDYEGPLDCIPTADPQVFSDAQRFAQINLVAGRAQGNPLYDQRKVEELILERTRIPNAKDLLVAKVEPKPMNAVNENVAMTMGRPVVAFPDQDHLAHLQVVLDFALSPYFGQLPLIAQTYMQAALNHLKEHMVLWYVSHTYELASRAVSEEIGKPIELSELMDSKDPESAKELDRLLATITSNHTMSDAARVFGKYPEILTQLQKLVQSVLPPPITDPSQAMLQSTQARIAGDLQKAELIQDRTDARDARKAETQSEITQLKEAGDSQRAHAQIESKESINKEDNLTALTIAGGEIARGDKSNLSTGTGINPSP